MLPSLGFSFPAASAAQASQRAFLVTGGIHGGALDKELREVMWDRSDAPTGYQPVSETVRARAEAVAPTLPTWAMVLGLVAVAALALTWE